MMEKDAKIYVAGHRGMVGSAICRELERQGYTNIITRTHAQLDLCRQDAVDAFFAEERPEYVFLAAAKVGGIQANSEAPADFLELFAEAARSITEALEDPRDGRGLLIVGDLLCISRRRCGDEELISLEV